MNREEGAEALDGLCAKAEPSARPPSDCSTLAVTIFSRYKKRARIPRRRHSLHSLELSREYQRCIEELGVAELFHGNAVRVARNTSGTGHLRGFRGSNL